jgi:predicted ester cyclase
MVNVEQNTALVRRAIKDRVAVRVTARATHSGPFMGVPATGRSYAIGEIHIFRIRDCKIAEHWHQFDGLSMMQQLKPPGTA